MTQVAGGTLTAYFFAPFPFPAGGTIIEEVQAASLPNCVHDVVVPFPGGFSAPNFCVPGLDLITNVTQTACGAGKLDSNGGSDFDTDEQADSSDTLNSECTAAGAPTACCTGAGTGTCTGVCPNFFQACTAGLNTKIRLDIKVGNGSADICVPANGMNALVSVPVHTESWADLSPGYFPAQDNSTCTGAGTPFSCCTGPGTGSCSCTYPPDCTGPGTPSPCCTGAGTGTCVCCKGDGVFNGSETFAATFDQILDFTTAKATGKWTDLDGDGCGLTTGSFGPAGGDGPKTGACIDPTKLNTASVAVTTVAVGEFGSTGPGDDGSFSTVLPNTISGPSGSISDTCASPPLINYSGTATRCIP